MLDQTNFSAFYSLFWLYNCINRFFLAVHTPTCSKVLVHVSLWLLLSYEMQHLKDWLLSVTNLALCCQNRAWNVVLTTHENSFTFHTTRVCLNAKEGNFWNLGFTIGKLLNMACNVIESQPESCLIHITKTLVKGTIPFVLCASKQITMH